MGRELTPHRITPLTPVPCDTVVSCGISTCFQVLSPCVGQIAHALLTRPPLECSLPSRRTSNYIPVRLACVKHAASVRPEPGSNSDVQSLSCSFPPRSCSPKQLRFTPDRRFSLRNLTVYSLPCLSRCIVFKDRAAIACDWIIIAIASKSVKRFWELHLDITQFHDISSHKKFIYERSCVTILQCIGFYEHCRRKFELNVRNHFL